MILADSSVWINHLIVDDSHLVSLLDEDQILIHPMVIGELACGNMRDRADMMRLFRRLPKILAASHDEVLFLIEYHQMMGRGIGFIDAHLLASTAMTPSTLLWTNDRRLMALASELGVAYGLT